MCQKENVETVSAQSPSANDSLTIPDYRSDLLVKID